MRICPTCNRPTGEFQVSGLNFQTYCECHGCSTEAVVSNVRANSHARFIAAHTRPANLGGAGRNRDCNEVAWIDPEKLEAALAE